MTNQMTPVPVMAMTPVMAAALVPADPSQDLAFPQRAGHSSCGHRTWSSPW
jgi:hypothetical protein